MTSLISIQSEKDALFVKELFIERNINVATIDDVLFNIIENDDRVCVLVYYNDDLCANCEYSKEIFEKITKEFIKNRLDIYYFLQDNQ